MQPDDRKTTDVAYVATIARAVAALRAAHDLSLDQVAARAGMSKSHVWKIEQGRIRNPTVATVRALARAFGVDPEPSRAHARQSAADSKSAEFRSAISRLRTA